MTIIFVPIFLSSCGGPSIKYLKDPASIEKIQIGVTTQREVHEMFGRPTYHGTRPTGEEWWTYYYAAPGEAQGASLSLDFTPEGKVKSFHYVPVDQRVSPVVKGHKEEESIIKLQQ